jgi:REP element-mobilizing transposase RayT
MPERKYQYRRNLPHLQRRGKLLFVTFCTFRRLELPPRARDIVLASCLRENEVRAYLLCAVVMPDHVHLLFKPMIDKDGESFSMAEIVGSIKSASAHEINKVLRRRGRVWQIESFDRVLRSNEDINQKASYILQNPIRRGLVKKVEDYRWYWHHSLASSRSPLQPRAAAATQDDK